MTPKNIHSFLIPHPHPPKKGKNIFLKKKPQNIEIQILNPL